MSHDPANPDDAPGHSYRPPEPQQEPVAPSPYGAGPADDALVTNAAVHGTQPPVELAHGLAHDGDDAAPETYDASDAQDAHDAASAPPSYYYDDPAERYADVPASLELSYNDADLGLSPRAYERAYPYEVVQKRRRKTAGARYRRVGRELAETLILALLIFFAVKAVIQNFRVEGASMEPTMHNNDYLLVNKALYFRLDTGRIHDILPFIPDSDNGDRHLFRPPRRGDVIVFRFPLDPSRDFIKRVIGVPGDTVEVHDETVYINGSPLKEDYILATPNYTYGPKTVPADMYFVLGDNRRNSFDSHAWGNSCSAQQQCDFVPEENIIGQAWVSYWPFDALGFIKNEDLKPQAP